MNDDSRLDCSDYPCSGCGFTQGDCHCTPEQVESAHHIAQHTQHKICPTCSGTGWIIGEFACMDHQCSKCGGSDKLRASA